MARISALDPLSGSPKIASAAALARQYPEELMHLEHVARLSRALFEALRPIHGLGQPECDLLCCAALLHDIGLSRSPQGHHRHSLKLILAADLPALTTAEREIVANVARYHRKAAPSTKHRAYRELEPAARDVVGKLAAILRIADGLDRAHENGVNCLEAEFAPDERSCRVDLYGSGHLPVAVWGARRKAGLFTDVFGVDLAFEAIGPVSDQRALT